MALCILLWALLLWAASALLNKCNSFPTDPKEKWVSDGSQTFRVSSSMGYVCSIKVQVTSPFPFFARCQNFSSVQKTANVIPVSSQLTCQEGACLLLEALPPSGHCWQTAPTLIPFSWEKESQEWPLPTLPNILLKVQSSFEFNKEVI